MSLFAFTSSTASLSRIWIECNVNQIVIKYCNLNSENLKGIYNRELTNIWKQPVIYTPIMCLAVLSSLLNLMRGGTSRMEAEASWGTESTEVPNVEKNLLLGTTAGRWCKLGVGPAQNLSVGAMPLLLESHEKLVFETYSCWKMEHLRITRMQ